MELSEAIRLGAMTSEQIVGGAMNGSGRCALSSAADACGLQPARTGRCPVTPYVKLAERFPVLRRIVTTPYTNPMHFETFGELDTVENIITVLNDYVGWTREQIADWVFQIEQGNASGPTKTRSDLLETH